MQHKYRIFFAIILASMLMFARVSPTLAAPPPNPIGVWDLSGYDQANNLWVASLVLIHGKNNAIIGFADWAANTGLGGREYVAGTYDATTRTLKFHGTKTLYPRGIVRGSYMAVFSADGNNLINGKWSASNAAIPGKWIAKRIVLK
ncbi:MAG: hypothetical protein ABL933_11990 [Methyloglobulus sp.]|nr:hypothetical protein [Methyloglobulus sp.]